MQGTVADSEIRIEWMRDPGKVKRKEGKEKMFFEKAKKLLTYLTNEFMIFLEYPLDYIEEFGDEMKKLDTTDKIIKIGKLLIGIFLLMQLVFGMIFAVILCLSLSDNGSGRSVAEDLYTRELKSAKADAESRARSGQGSWSEVADIEQEIRNNTPVKEDHFDD